MRNALIILSAIISLLFAPGSDSHAQMVSPGKLAKSHGKLEGINNCLKCHALMTGIADSSCNACHEKLNQRIKEKRGLHARVEGACTDCHTEHQGEDYDITGLEPDTFDHDRTGYSLKGKHKISCGKCHKKEKTYLDVSYECLNCHADVHKKSLPEDCGRCHNFSGWKDLEFDHAKNAEYSLTGRHTDLKCDLCHPRTPVQKEAGDIGNVLNVLKFKPVPHGKCSDCHEDIHNGLLKDKACSSCHETKGWKETVFKHNDPAMSNYTLSGKHEQVACNLCHPEENGHYKKDGKRITVQTIKIKPLKHDSCTDCHYDVHKGQFKKQQCDGCHSLKKGWKEVTFRHDSETYRGYKLEGRHKEASCEKCHEKSEISYSEFRKDKTVSAGRFRPLKAETCVDCHYDVHKGQFEKRKCEECHSLKNGWKEILFKHDSPAYSGYKLEGKHKDVVCERCHERSDVSYTEFNSRKKVYVGKFKPFGSGKCDDCHFDVHKGQFKERKCGDCHSGEKEWRDSTFNHESEKESSYRIEGKHKGVVCEKCHERSEVRYTEFGILKKAQPGKFKPVKSAQCNDCHKDDHKGKYKNIEKVEGVTCNNCHFVDKEWKDYVYKHKPESKYTRYNPTGQISETDCGACHMCESDTFCISCCFEKMGMIPTQ